MIGEQFVTTAGSTIWWSGQSPIASAKDMTLAQTLALTVQSSDVANGGETMEYVTVEVEP